MVILWFIQLQLLLLVVVVIGQCTCSATTTTSSSSNSPKSSTPDITIGLSNDPEKINNSKLGGIEPQIRWSHTKTIGNNWDIVGGIDVIVEGIELDEMPYSIWGKIKKSITIPSTNAIANRLMNNIGMGTSGSSSSSIVPSRSSKDDDEEKIDISLRGEIKAIDLHKINFDLQAHNEKKAGGGGSKVQILGSGHISSNYDMIDWTVERINGHTSVDIPSAGKLSISPHFDINNMKSSDVTFKFDIKDDSKSTSILVDTSLTHGQRLTIRRNIFNNRNIIIPSITIPNKEVALSYQRMLLPPPTVRRGSSSSSSVIGSAGSITTTIKPKDYVSVTYADGPWNAIFKSPFVDGSYTRLNGINISIKRQVDVM